MPDPPTTSPLSDQEQIAVELLSKRWGVALSHDQVTMYLDNFRQKQTTLDEIPDILEMSPEKRAALLCHLNLSEGGNTLEELSQQHIIGIYGQIVFGYDLIEDFETYWRYEPTIEKILELSYVFTPR
uniref:hypothetical protein n=1 Tax=Halorubrum halophilum TaxID=413816 RepID=UPI0012ABFDA1